MFSPFFYQYQETGRTPYAPCPCESGLPGLQAAYYRPSLPDSTVFVCKFFLNV
jgi:hypothetical protein